MTLNVCYVFVYVFLLKKVRFIVIAMFINCWILIPFISTNVIELFDVNYCYILTKRYLCHLLYVNKHDYFVKMIVFVPV